MKSELLNKVLDAIKEPIVGNYLFSEDELEDIYTYANGLFRKFGSLSTEDECVIFVALVNLAKKWDFEGSLLEFLFRKFSSNKDYHNIIYDRIRETIDGLCNYKKIYQIKCGKYYYGTICSHAFSPSKSINAFFDLCWNVYCQDLGEQYVRHDPIFKAITHAINEKFNGIKNPDSDNFTVGGSAYSLRIGIVKLPSSDNGVFCWLLDETIGLINSFFRGKKIEQNTYLKLLVEQWWQKKTASFGVKTIKPSYTPAEEPVIDYSNIKVRYSFIKDRPYILIPPIRLIDNTDKKPVVVIHYDEKVVLTEEIEVYGSGIIMSTSPKRIPINLENYSSFKLSLTILHNNQVIYDSKESLYRDFILFKGEKEITSNEVIPGKHYLVIINKNLVSFSGRRVRTITYSTEEIAFYEGDSIQTSDRCVMFLFENSKRDIYVFSNKIAGAVFQFHNTEYKIIDGDVKIGASNKINIEDIGIRYEEAPLRLIDFPKIIYNGYEHYVITELLNAGVPQRITVFRFSDGKILETLDVVKFDNVRISYDKELYFGDDNVGKATFEADGFCVSSSFVANNKKVLLHLTNGDVVATIPLLEWKINDGLWQSEPMLGGIWHGDLPLETTLSIKYLSNSFSVYAGQQEISKANNSDTTYSLGLAICKEIAKRQNENDCSFLVYCKNGDKEYPLFNVFFREAFLFSPMLIDGDNKTIEWDPISYRGKKDAEFLAVFKNSDNKMTNINLSLEKTSIDCSKLIDDYYHISVYPISNGAVNYKTPLFKKRVAIGDEKAIKYKNVSFLVNEAVISGRIPLLKKTSPFYVDSIVYLGTKDGADYYSGSIFYFREDRKKRYLNFIKSLDGRTVQINPVRIEIKTSRTFYMGYGLDINDEDLEYDNEFALNKGGFITIETKIGGTKTEPIDYYVFSIGLEKRQ